MNTSFDFVNVGIITAGVGGAAKVFGKDVGLGNQLFGAAGLIANALRLNRVPTVGYCTPVPCVRLCGSRMRDGRLM